MDVPILAGALGRLGQRVSRIRAGQGLSQTELARRARLTQPRISQIERGRGDRPLPLRTLCGLADGLGVDLASLIADDPAYEFLDVEDAWPLVPPPLAAFRSPVPLLGRGDDVAAIAAALRGGARVLTLVGPGGVGKTQLALAAASEVEDTFAQGTHVVPLAACHDAAGVNATIAHIVGVREQQDTLPLLDRLLLTLHPRQMLLLLDNVEQVVSTAAALVTQMTVNCPLLTILVTSRTPLNISREQPYEVLPLTCPDVEAPPTLARALQAPAVQLFAQRAREANRSFVLTETHAADVSAICQRLDGLPLAIELAAARVRLLRPDHLLRQLDQRLALLTSGARDAPPRHQSLRACIAWSFDLLTADQRDLVRRLAVFADGFTLEAAAEVASEEPVAASIAPGSPFIYPLPPPAITDGVEALLEHHLLTRSVQADGVPRFRMLESVRAFAMEQLVASGETDAQRQRHLAWALALAERAEPALFSSAQALWLRRLDADWENLRAALGFGVETGEAEATLRLAVALTDYWYLRGLLSEGAQWLDWALALSPQTSPGRSLAVARVRALAAASQLAQPRGYLAGASSRAEQALSLAREIGDHLGEARALALLANHALVQDDLDRAEFLHSAALPIFREFDDRSWVVSVLNNLSLIAYERGDVERAETLASETLALANTYGDSWGAAMAHQRLGDALLARLQPERAASCFIQSLTLSQRYEFQLGVVNAIAACASYAGVSHAPERAARLFAAANAGYRHLGIRVPPKLRPDWARMLERTRAAVSKDVFADAWDAGSRLTIEEAATEALGPCAGSPAGELLAQREARAWNRRQRVHANVLVRKTGTKPSFS